ncbi:hypothetical protein [Paludifilum halophilum]|uniref:Uncharacterized protein n=1 Tax=Paludifilum halophilum TaxID=1642702 RepID=A0A235B6X7_9BACL|nr:hypothetical protein [Paludifilum halophilum]OYD07739.1 hypothetical protein CHM34_09720 [Paludifilum halophilum]
MMRPEQIHVFNSRKEVFSRDSVLQENIILNAVKSLDQWPLDKEVIVSISGGSADLVSPIIIGKEIRSEIEKDKYLVNKSDWEIIWVFENANASKPLIEELKQAGIGIKFIKKGGK